MSVTCFVTSTIFKHAPGLVITASYFLWLGPAPRLYTTTTQRRPDALRHILDEIVFVQLQLSPRLPVPREQELWCNALVHPVPRAAVAAEGAAVAQRFNLCGHPHGSRGESRAQLQCVGSHDDTRQHHQPEIASRVASFCVQPR